MRTLDLIEYVVAHPAGVSAQDIASALGIPKSSLSYLLVTLVERHYLNRDGRLYSAGAGLDRLRRPDADRSLAERGAPLIRALRLQLNETASLFEPEGWEMVVMLTETAEQKLRYALDVGSRMPLHCVSAGKAYLAALPDDRLERYFRESERVAFTDRTIVDEGALRVELARVREDGFARATDEYTRGITAIGRAIVIRGVPVAAVSVSVPVSRFEPPVEREVIEQVMRTARALEDLAG